MKLLRYRKQYPFLYAQWYNGEKYNDIKYVCLQFPRDANNSPRSTIISNKKNRTKEVNKLNNKPSYLTEKKSKYKHIKCTYFIQAISYLQQKQACTHDKEE